MARNYPADTRGQRVLEELYEKERKAQINWFLKNVQAKRDNPGRVISPEEIMEMKVPNPREVLPKHLFEKTNNQTPPVEEKSIEFISKPSRGKESDLEAKAFDDMYPPDWQTLKLLYNGISKEQKGRYDYLKHRNGLDVEQRYRYPIRSSMEYGWDQAQLIKTGLIGKHRVHGRVKIIEESFYRRNRIPMEHCAEMF